MAASGCGKSVFFLRKTAQKYGFMRDSFKRLIITIPVTSEKVSTSFSANKINYFHGNRQHLERGVSNLRIEHDGSQCWNCSGNVKKKQFFCSSCGKIQAPNPSINYFEIFDIPVSFKINTTKLTKSFRDHQRLLHPDRFGRSSETEQEYSSQQSTMVNKAYSTLLKPLKRGFYILKIQGLLLDEGKTEAQGEFLMEIMEKNEEISSAKSTEDIMKIVAENQKDIDSLLREIEAAFGAGDNEAAMKLLIRLKYFATIEERVKEKIPTS